MSTSRRCEDFISTFVADTERFGSPAIFRRWTAIALIGAALRQNVWVKTASRLHPNIYAILVAHPGVGKTRVLNYGRDLAHAVPELHLAPISMTFASMTDALVDANCEVIRQPEGKLNYNSMQIIADELGAFVHKYDNEMIAGLTAFYDPTPYQQTRRTGGKDGAGIKIEIKSPQLNIICGSTPQNLLSFIPEGAWGQGFTSRLVLIFSDQRIIIDDFADHGKPQSEDMIATLRHFTTLYGQFSVHPDYRAAVNQWKAAGELPMPSHPRLTHYITRRRVHLYKLSMISAINRGDDLTLLEPDFFTALEWLAQAELHMPDIFKAGATNADSEAMSDIVHWIKITDLGTGVSEQKIISYAQARVPINSILRIIEILETSGQIKMVRLDRHTLAKHYSVVPDSSPSELGVHAPVDPGLKVIQLPLDKAAGR